MDEVYTLAHYINETDGKEYVVIITGHIENVGGAGMAEEYQRPGYKLDSLSEVYTDSSILPADKVLQ